MGYDSTEILGATENNLKNIKLKVLKGQITIFTGIMDVIRKLFAEENKVSVQRNI